MPCPDEFSAHEDEDDETTCSVRAFVVDGVLEVDESDLDVGAPALVDLDALVDERNGEDGDSSIRFPKFELPALTEELAAAMEEEMDAGVFVDMWRRVAQHSQTITVEIGKY